MIKFDKEKYRKVAKTAIKKESKRVANCYKNRLNFDILKLIKLYKVKNLLVFIPMATEPNLIKLRRKLSKNCTIFVPFMVDKSLKMVKLRLPFFVSIVLRPLSISASGPSSLLFCPSSLIFHSPSCRIYHIPDCRL